MLFFRTVQEMPLRWKNSIYQEKAGNAVLKKLYVTIKEKGERQMEKTKATYLLKHTGMYEEASRRYDELVTIRKKLEEKLVKSPQGKIRISTSDRQPQYYLKKDKSDASWKYISKTEKTKLKQYVQKAYNEKMLRLIDNLSAGGFFFEQSQCFRSIDV